MIISKAVDHIIGQSPFLEESLNDKLINIAALARLMKPEVEKLVKNEVQAGAIVMAINRRSQESTFRVNKQIRNVMHSLGDIVVRSGLIDYTFERSSTFGGCQHRFIGEVSAERDSFYTFSQGVKEITLVAGKTLDEAIRNVFRKEKLLSSKYDLSSITIQLPQNNTEVSGVYYYILKHLAWKGINVTEIISTTNEITIVVSEEDAKRAFPILMDLKRNTGQ